MRESATNDVRITFSDLSPALKAAVIFAYIYGMVVAGYILLLIVGFILGIIGMFV